MEEISRDVIYLICQKLDMKSILNLSLVNKRTNEKIFLHPNLILDKIPPNGISNSFKRCRFLTYQIKTSLRSVLFKLDEIKDEQIKNKFVQN